MIFTMFCKKAPPDGVLLQSDATAATQVLQLAKVSEPVRETCPSFIMSFKNMYLYCIKKVTY